MYTIQLLFFSWGKKELDSKRRRIKRTEKKRKQKKGVGGWMDGGG